MIICFEFDFIYFVQFNLDLIRRKVNLQAVIFKRIKFEEVFLDFFVRFLRSIWGVCSTRPGVSHETEANHANKCLVVDCFRGEIQQSREAGPLERQQPEARRPLAQSRPPTAPQKNQGLSWADAATKKKCATRRTSTHLPAGIEGVRTHARIRIPLAYVCRSVLSREHWRMALSKLGKIIVGRTRRIGQAWAVSYYTDQLMTPCSRYFSGGSTLNGTPGGDRWARILGGQIGWLSEPPHRVGANCSGCTKLNMLLPEKQQKIPPHREHTTKPTSAQRPRPPRDGARKTTSHALAHARPLPYIPGLWKSASYSSRSQ